MRGPPVGLGQVNCDVQRKPAENHSPTKLTRNCPGAPLWACCVLSRPTPPVSVFDSFTSSSRAAHSAFCAASCASCAACSGVTAGASGDAPSAGAPSAGAGGAVVSAGGCGAAVSAGGGVAGAAGCAAPPAGPAPCCARAVPASARPAAKTSATKYEERSERQLMRTLSRIGERASPPTCRPCEPSEGEAHYVRCVRGLEPFITNSRTFSTMLWPSPSSASQ